MPSSAPSSSRSSAMSAVASRPSTPGRDRAVTQPLEQLGPVGHGVGVAGGAQSAAGRVVAGDDHQPAVAAGELRRRRAASSARSARARRPDVADLGDRGDEAVRLGAAGARMAGLVMTSLRPAGRARRTRRRTARWDRPRRAGSRSPSAVGMAVEHSSREATMAPAALASGSTFSSGQPASRPWHSEPPKESPAPRPFSGWIGIGGETDPLGTGLGQHALGTLLDDRPARPRRRAARRPPAPGRSRRPRPRTPRGCRRPP